VRWERYWSAGELVAFRVVLDFIPACSIKKFKGRLFPIIKKPESEPVGAATGFFYGQ
jgi:hypothetical protein